MCQNLKTQTVTNLKIKTQIVSKVNNSIGDKTQTYKLWQLKMWQTSKTQDVKEKKLKNLKCDKTQKLKMWQNSKTQLWQNLTIVMVKTFSKKKMLHIDRQWWQN